ncbi:MULTISPECIES: alpha-L-rhamnosidase [Bacillus]|uniref:alpha-L-rhamnosidase n=1 Tax=Bacillus glycinifermentans TaxID=1664069 RepID=A0AAJ3YZT4_9BACI|nr:MULTISPECIES: alpha-L-rhamnosidase [Bacillus]KKB73056.1 alfa-L-rhamnosidase RamA [Bacillus sp. TH008]MDU0070751.1 family 78 glycoside hydrolase catalytic domain [Bacillus sp. IG6]MED8018677.1 family 78 glycoside hydrolase catalytic domain [Bacillus glycinifermentans]QAT66171.1 alfa-L-rhamnosidase RamA [Bacillus glycinifermentans]WKB75881.1 family 78 glycoside hydrolase catalytic domain [Bacillus glycinifermentans]
MKIHQLKTNRITNPLGFLLENPRVSYVVIDTKAQKQSAAQIEVATDKDFTAVIYDSGKRGDIDSLAFELPIKLEPRTRYYWRVHVWADNGDYAVSEAAWFETAKMDEEWGAKWITPLLEPTVHPVLVKAFSIDKEVESVRIYASGLGVYEMTVNGEKAGNEFLAPHFNAYDKWIQYQTYDVTRLVQQGENTVEVMLGNGWYKGRFGFEGNAENLYGDRFAFISECHIVYRDGSREVIPSDLSWNARKSKVLDSNIYDGEIYDATLDTIQEYGVKEIDLGYDRLTDRLSLPVVTKEEIQPIEIISTPRGETVIDLGQNMVGWLQFRTRAPKGTVITLQYGEVLQDGSFYRDNLRTAKAEYTYIADGRERTVRPFHTFYGFRYVKVEGWPGELRPEDFTGCVIYSDMDQIGHIETSNQDVNRLFLNALWGQKGNFLDVPTDCPQRDERMGWTGDAQVFCGTANFNMDTYAFFRKYCYDMGKEQEARGGMVPMVVPAVNVHGGGSSAWGDAATVIPWNVYLHYGDQAILKQQFKSMKSWVDFIKKADDESGERRLWTEGFHFGDWLALDGSDPDSPMGGTDPAFIASAYYCYSAELVAKAATVLGDLEGAKRYGQLASEIRRSIQKEFFTENGRLAVPTQTGYAVALFMNLVPDEHKQRIADDLRHRLRLDKNHLRTGFVGTPFMNRVLSAFGSNDIAYTLLLNDDFPSWLYAVKMGATTIWERWNSIQPDGKMSESGMNSLNHYAYGAVVEWMYRTVAGINPSAEKPGFRHTLLAPQPDFRLKWVKASLQSAAGLYKSEWTFNEKGHLSFVFTIPFNATATVRLPDANVLDISINGQRITDAEIPTIQSGKHVQIELASGTWNIFYAPTRRYIKRLSTRTPLGELLENRQAKRILAELSPMVADLDPQVMGHAAQASIRELTAYPSFAAPDELLDELDDKLSKIEV